MRETPVVLAAPASAVVVVAAAAAGTWWRQAAVVVVVPSVAGRLGRAMAAPETPALAVPAETPEIRAPLLQL